MTALIVDMGGVSYRSPDLTPTQHHAMAVAVHNALAGLGLEPFVRAHGFERDEWGALRQKPNLARQTTERAP